MTETVSSPAVLVAIRGPHLAPGTEFPLSAEITAVGRSPESTIPLNDFTVSHRHAEIHRRGAVFLLLDVGSMHGTYVNRNPVRETVLADGDEIQVGRYRLTFRVDRR